MRHLSEGLNSNWEALNTAKVKVAHLLDEANNIVKMFGSDLGKSKFQEDVNLIASLRDKIESQLAYFKIRLKANLIVIVRRFIKIFCRIRNPFLLYLQNW
ncbi:MAG: hypothetical protein IPO72_11815 [Saprospiraceae bacterium]|nr:hypothetical protein [Candidatus Vicinibacter affinis]